MQESTSLLILWLLSSLKQERSTLCLIQMLECPAAQAEIALHRVTADGLAEQRDETWNLTQAGADHLREALPALLFRDTGSPLEELISACESKMPETACEICTKRMRVLRRRADTAGSAGYLSCSSISSRSGKTAGSPPRKPVPSSIMPLPPTTPPSII